MSSYLPLIKALSSWPGLGSVMTHRLLDGFLSQRALLQSLEQIHSYIKQHPLCLECNLPHHQHKECKNCSKNNETLIVFTKVIDAMIYDYIHPGNQYRIFALKGSLDHKLHSQPSDIGIDQLESVINNLNINSIILVSCNSTESQATQYYLSQLFKNTKLIKAQWPNPRVPTLSAFTPQDISRLHDNINELLKES